MASILTEQFRKNSANLLLADIQTSSYYVGIGKSDDWYEPLAPNTNAPFPNGTVDDVRAVQYALTDLIRVNTSDAGYVIPRVILTSSVYKQYDTYDSSCFYASGETKPCYFVDDDSGNIYLFIYSKSGVAINQTDISNQLYFIQAGSPIIYFGSSHIAVYVGKTVILSPFNNEQFVEVDSAIIPLDAPNGYAGRVHGFHVLGGGNITETTAPYTPITNTSLPGTMTVRAMNESAALDIDVTLSISNGVITEVALGDTYRSYLINNSDEITSFDFTSGCTATLTIDGVTIATVPNIAAMVSVNGFGYNVREYTPSWYMGILANSRESAHPVYSGYGQVSLLKNPKNQSDDIITAQTVDMKKSFVLSGFSTNVSGYQITQGAKKIGVVDSVNTATGTVYYNNSVKYGFDTPTVGSTVTFVKTGETNVVSVATVSAPTSPDFQYGSADVLFIDNRATIQRSADQNEELKIIIQL